MSDPVVAGSIEFAGEQFKVADQVGLMPLMRFAVIAKSGVDSNEMEALAAMYALLEQVIADDEWDRFQDVACRKRVDGDELMKVVGRAIEAMSNRPTKQPSDSSGGLSTTSGSSAVDSSSQVIDRLVAEGRPDRALVVKRIQDFRRSA